MYGPPFGYSPYPVYMPGGDNADAVSLAKQVLKMHKAEKKKKSEEEKKKEAKSKPRVFTFLETTGLVLLGSIPITLCQLWLISYAQTMMNSLLNAH